MRNPALTIPLFRTPAVLDAGAVGAAYRALWPGDPDPAAGDYGDGTLGCTAVGLRCAVSVRPGPVPGDDLARAAATATRWPDAATAVAGHAAHGVVFAPAADDPLQPFFAATKVTAAVVRATGAAGVYVGGAGLLVPAEVWLAEAAAGALPMGLWLATGVTEDRASGWVSVYTAGMGQFGLPDVEVVSRAELPEEVRERALRLALHAALLGGFDDGVRSGDDVVRHAPSGLDRPGLVYRVER